MNPANLAEVEHTPPASHVAAPKQPSSQGSSSSLQDDLNRVHRVKAEPLRGRSASLDTSATALRDGSYDEDGGEQGTR